MCWYKWKYIHVEQRGLVATEWSRLYYSFKTINDYIKPAKAPLSNLLIMLPPGLWCYSTGNKQLLVITGALIVRKLTQRAMNYHQQWYLFLLHWIIQSLIQLRCLRFVNSHPDLHITFLVITGALIESTVTKITMSCHHRWYLCLIHWMIQSLIYLSCTWFVNSHTYLHRT